MGKIEDALSFLAVKRMNLGVYDKLNADQKELYMTNLKREIDDELRAKALQECILNRYRAHYSKLLDDGDGDEVLPLMKEINEIKKKNDEETIKSDYCFITLSPDPKKNTPLGEFRKAVEKASKKSFIKKSLYVIEQRSSTEDNMGTGFHAHMLINKGDYRMSHMRREFARTFKDIIDTENYGAFNFKLCKKSDLGNRQNYMLGDKKDPEKQKKQIIDRLWREKLFITPFYGEVFDEDIALFAAGL